MINWRISDVLVYDLNRTSFGDPEIRLLADGKWYVLREGPDRKLLEYSLIPAKKAQELIAAGPFEDLDTARSAFVLLYGGES